MNFIDTTANKRNRFEILKKTLIFNQILAKKPINFLYSDLTRAHNPLVFKGFNKVDGKNSSFEEYKRLF